MSDEDQSTLGSATMLISTWLALQTAAIGFRLLFAGQPPGWSETVLDTTWAALPDGAFTFAIALMRIAGAGLFLTGAAMGVIAVGPGWKGEAWARWTPPALGVVLYATLVVVLLGLHNTTGADTPWIPAAVSASACGLGMILAAAASRPPPE